jgi:hypothetical protein
MLSIQIYIIIGITITVISMVTLFFYWIKAGKVRAANEEKDRILAENNKVVIEASIQQRIAEKTATIEAEKVKQETKESLDKGNLDYFDKHPFS